ncbi:hypothetical protein [Saccharothrix yanglingensis]|uniref:Uncharacterized protein n=1 Tax=Saccharothrix yanglingensis TaxID=659496 RepID=A0ABU0X9G3_9PSEU|nr:hypothetical protein [Saccharothrix yanglingensis]MDQ2588780.1 hypothetical protein [Saccharothrix yanglingensis]
MSDAVDAVPAQWARERPDVDLVDGMLAEHVRLLEPLDARTRTAVADALRSLPEGCGQPCAHCC